MTTRDDVSAGRGLRHAIDRDGLLDLHIGVMLLLSAGLGWLGWRLMGHPGLFVAIVPVFLAGSLGQLRQRYTFPRLGCPDYQPEAEKRFALIVLTVLALLGVVVLALTALFRAWLSDWFWRNVPVWLALGAAGLFCLLAWWYRAPRYVCYAVAAAVAVAVGYLLGLRTLLKLGLFIIVTGTAMTLVGTRNLARFSRRHPRLPASNGHGGVPCTGS